MNNLKILSISIVLLLVLIPPNHAEEIWHIWSGNLRPSNPARADSIDSAIIAWFGSWHELKQPSTNWEYKINGEWVEQEETGDTLTLPMKYVWSVTDSTVEIFRRDTKPYSMKWYYNVLGESIVDEDYELHAVNLILGSLTIKDTIFITQDNRLKDLRVPNKVVEHRQMVLKKKAKKLKKVLDLMGTELWARSLDGKQHNVFGNRIRDFWLKLEWPSDEKQWRPMSWKLLKLESKRRILLSRIEMSSVRKYKVEP